jgi:hypothetical protein
VRTVVATARYWAPFVFSALCLTIACFVGATAAWILLLFAFGSLLDGATAMFERAGSTGGLTTYRQ